MRSYLSWVKMGERIFLGERAVGIKALCWEKADMHRDVRHGVINNSAPVDSLGSILCKYVLFMGPGDQRVSIPSFYNIG